MSPETRQLRTLALGRRDAPFYRSIESAMFAFGDVTYCSERRFPAGLGLQGYLRRHQIDRVLMPNAYGNPQRLACYRRLRAEGVPTIVCDRGALPESWFFDEGFLADSEAYSQERWDHELEESQRDEVRAYVRELRSSAVALERQGPRREATALTRALDLPAGHRVLFAPLQRPHDTAVRFFSGPMGDHRGFESLLRALAARLGRAEVPWSVVVKQHPLEETLPDVPGVVVAPGDAHIHDLLELADGVLVLTSGVGLLSLAFGKPTFHAGRPFYAQPGLSRAVSRVEDAAVSIAAAEAPDPVRVERFLHHLLKRVYSFGESTTSLARDRRGRQFRATEHIGFRDLRILGEASPVATPRVLVLSPIPPWPADRGSAARMHAMLRALIERGAQVSLCTMFDDADGDAQQTRTRLAARYPEAQTIEVVPRAKRGISRASREARRVAGFLSGGFHEVSNLETCPPAFRRRVAVLCADTHATHLLVNYAKLTPAIPDDFRGVTIVDTHDCQTRLVQESQRYAGTRRFVNLSRHEESERRALSRYQRIIAIHPGEAQTFARWASEAEVTFIPHFTNAAPLPSLSVEAARYDAFFIGSQSSFNVLALRWLLEEILPRVRRRIPGFRLAAVGAMSDDRRIPAGLRGQAEMLGRIPDIERIYREGRVVVAPIRAGAGMKTKVIEALARRRPVVCTAVAADGIGLEHGRSAWLADDADGLAEGLVALHRDTGLWESLAAGGSDLHVREHSPEAIAPSLDILLRRGASAKRSVP